MNRVVHFEIQASDVVRATNFYQTVFGWKFDKWGDNDYWMITTGESNDTEKYPGINGGLLPRKGGMPTEDQPLNAYACTIQVDNIDEAIQKVEAAGGTLFQAKYAMVGMAWQAYYKDTEGNFFGLHQADENAK